MPILCSCHLCTVHHLSSKQVSDRLCPNPNCHSLVLMKILHFSMLSLVVHMVVHLHNTYLTTFVAFSLTLNTISFEYSTLEWFAISTCIAIAVDLLPSSMQLRNSYRISRDTRNLVQVLYAYYII